MDDGCVLEELDAEHRRRIEGRHAVIASGGSGEYDEQPSGSLHNKIEGRPKLKRVKCT